MASSSKRKFIHLTFNSDDSHKTDQPNKKFKSSYSKHDIDTNNQCNMNPPSSVKHTQTNDDTQNIINFSQPNNITNNLIYEYIEAEEANISFLDDNTTLNKHWNSLDYLPINILRGNAIKWNDNEFIIASDTYKNQTHWIYKYNIHTQEWHQFIEYPFDLALSGQRMVAVHHMHKLYLSGNDNLMTIIDTKTKQFETYFNPNNMENGHYPGLVNVNGTIHRIGNEGSSKHLIWNDVNHSFQEIYRFKEYNEIYGTSLVYIACKKMILLIGGWNDGKMISNVWGYCLVSNKWHKIQGITFDFYCASSVLTSDEHYIVIFGGLDNKHKDVDTIHILDLRENDYKLRQSNIGCPKKGYHHIIGIGSRERYQILVIGWIKKYKLSKNTTCISNDIIRLIADWYDQETIHWMERGWPDQQKKHFSIHLKYILSS